MNNSNNSKNKPHPPQKPDQYENISDLTTGLEAEFVASLSEAQTVEDFRDSVIAILKPYNGLSDFSVFSTTSLVAIEDSPLITNPRSLLRTYTEEAFFEVDTMVSYAMNADNNPIYQSNAQEFAHTAGFDTEQFKRNREICTLNRQYGYYDYYCTVSKSCSGSGNMLFSVTARHTSSSKVKEIIQPHTQAIEILAHTVNAVGSKLFPEFFGDKDDESGTITNRPLEIFKKMVFEDKTPQEIAFELNISPNAVLKNASRGRAALGVRTNEAAVRELIKRKLITA